MLVEALFALGLLMFIVWWTMSSPRASDSSVRLHDAEEAGGIASLPDADADRDRTGRGDA